MSTYSDLCSAISREVAIYANVGATLSWATGQRRAEAIIRRGGVERRVHFARRPSRHDTTATLGRVRRALREVGVQDVATPPVAPASKPKRKRKPRTHEARIKALEAALASALERIEMLEKGSDGVRLSASA